MEVAWNWVMGRVCKSLEEGTRKKLHYHEGCIKDNYCEGLGKERAQEKIKRREKVCNFLEII